MEKLDKGMSQVPGGTEWDGVIFHHATQNSVHFKTDDLFPSGIFPLVCSDHDWLWSLKQQTAGWGRGAAAYLTSFSRTGWGECQRSHLPTEVTKMVQSKCESILQGHRERKFKVQKRADYATSPRTEKTHYVIKEKNQYIKSCVQMLIHSNK